MPNAISGNAGVAGAAVAYTGTSSGSVTADGSGNYTISGLNNGPYTLTPSLAGYGFSPTYSNQTISGVDITGVNFIANTRPSLFDNFQRANGALGGNWRLGFSGNAEGLVGLGSIGITSNAYGSLGTHSADALASWIGGQSFKNDQYAQGSIAAIAAYTSTISITAASFSTPNTTYTYTLTTGNALIVGQPFRITGMTNPGNNGFFVITGLGGGTFTVTNASGVTEAGSSGIGISPSDSNSGFALRASADGQSAYFGIIGTNSFSGDGRLYDNEIWKVVSGVGTFLAGVTPTTVTDSVNDVYVFTVQGTQLTLWKNGVQMLTVGDVTLTSGLPGIWSWSISGPNEFKWGSWNSSGVMGVDPPGNSGTRFTNWQAGQSSNPIFAQGFQDSFPYANGSLHTANPAWVYVGASSFTVSANKVYSNVAGISMAYRNDSIPCSDQYSEATMVITAVSGTQNNGPAVRINQNATVTTHTAYAIQCATDLFNLVKIVNGTVTTLLSLGASPVTGDVVRLEAEGPFLRAYKNGVLLTTFLDTSITMGQIGIFSAGSATANGISASDGGKISAQPNTGGGGGGGGDLGPSYDFRIRI